MFWLVERLQQYYWMDSEADFLSNSFMHKFWRIRTSTYVCFEERNNSQFMFERVKFNAEKGCSRFNLYYVPLLFSNKKQDSEVFFVKSRDETRKRISWFVIIHPMVKKDQICKKSNGDTVLTHYWRIRTAMGLCVFVPWSSDLCVFVED